MYFHGLGIGYFSYLPTLHALLAANPGRGVILVDLPHVSIAPFNVILDYDQTIKAVDAMFTCHCLEKVSLVGHSCGSIIASWLIQQQPQYLAHAHLVDPEPNCIFHKFMWFVLSKDPNISKAISKELYIYETVIFPKNITIPTTVFLADNEFSIDSVATKEYLEKQLPSHSKLMMMDTFHSGVVFQLFP
ncbi:hypothetical protein DSO57_1003051 [Entomophthora muscae]|uniref:Uncharacterized protein n=1 Tax=Entomophthora muscae TaxID=34485 RepID=A0ACC2TJF6_9FUNG|nr:hypothetical protein DSO57_1003051 [Entomophthora muscae]